jgi:dihydroorotate dehydrogenase (NAD+) catalytic subunit
VRMEQSLFGAPFPNPVLLAAGTCGFGEEVAEVTPLALLGGLVTKSVTLEPRKGNPAPRVAEFRAGMVNSIGLANPGAREVRRTKLPWIRDNLGGMRVFVSVAGHTPQEYLEIVRLLDDADGFLGYELNLSCPNDTRLGGLPFALDPEALSQVVTGVRALTSRPLLVKLAPNAPDLGPVVRAAEEAGADGLTLVNTLPGLVLDPRSRRPALGAGPGGVSGPALRAVGVHAVWRARRSTGLPLVGVGGIAGGEDAVQYLLAGASLVQVGTASFWDPRSAGRVIKELERFGRRERIAHVSELVGGARMESGGVPSDPGPAVASPPRNDRPGPV